MAVVRVPVSTYSIQSPKPTYAFGSPGALPNKVNTHRILVSVKFDYNVIPADATITSAILRMWFHKAAANPFHINAFPITKTWNSKVTWKTQPTYGSQITGITIPSPVSGTAIALNITNWVKTRPRYGLRVSTNTNSYGWIKGSAASINKPYVEVTYTIIPKVPTSLKPDGGAVSVPEPVLQFAGDEDMTQQRIQFSPTGSASDITYDTGFLAATDGMYDPVLDPGANPALIDGGPGIFWRAMTNGPEGESKWSEFADYSYKSLPAVVITSPLATSQDGEPTVRWTVTPDTQTAWEAALYEGAVRKDISGLKSGTDKEWDPQKGIKVPGGIGRVTVRVRDNVAPRVAANDAPTEVTVSHDFTTISATTGLAVATLAMDFNDPIPVFRGTRTQGIPDEISLFRDNVQVDIWDPETGVAYKWAPGSAFFPDNVNFVNIADFTADLRHEHTWRVKVRNAGIVDGDGPTVTAKLWTPSVWIVDPTDGRKIEIFGAGEVPTVEQTTEEGAILHAPVHGDLRIEVVRRRLMRTTRAGSITGLVFDQDEQTLDDWTQSDSGRKYRLIFGKVNMPVIIGDYSPVDDFYSENCGPDRLLISFNWWERLSNT